MPDNRSNCFPSNSSSSNTVSSSKGFTLVEILVALVVFAAVSVALVKNTSSSLRNAQVIEEKTVAWWLAENEMTELRLQPRTDDSYPSSGVDREIAEIGDSAYEIETDIEATENEYVRRVTIRVYREFSDDPAVELVGFLGRY